MGLECRVGLERRVGSGLGSRLGAWLGSGVGARMGLECWLGLECGVGLECGLGLGSRLEQRLLLEQWLGSAGGGSVHALSAEAVEPAVEWIARALPASWSDGLHGVEYRGWCRAGDRRCAARELPRSQLGGCGGSGSVGPFVEYRSGIARQRQLRQVQQWRQRERRRAAARCSAGKPCRGASVPARS